MKVTKEKKQLAIEVFGYILRNWDYFEKVKIYSAQGVIYLSSRLGRKQQDVMSVFALVAKSVEWAVLISSIGYTRGNVGKMIEHVESLRVRV